MKANRIEQTENAVLKWGVPVPQEINEIESHLYHLLMVQRVHRPSQEDYLTTSRIIKFGQKDYFDKVQGKGKKQANFLNLIGYTNVFVLHDPTIKEPIKSSVPNAKEAAKAIREAKTIEELESLILEGEDRSTVLEAIEKKQTELNTID